MARMDPRHRGLFGAAWTLASIGEAARGGLAAISPAALVGEFGIVHRRLPYDQPWFDDLGRAAVYPVYHVVAGMARAAGRPLVEATSSDRTRIAALAHRTANDAISLWLANLRDYPQQVMLPDINANARLGRLDESTFDAAATDPAFLYAHATSLSSREIEIGAHGIVCIQMER
jgi:hypothetical protein